MDQKEQWFFGPYSLDPQQAQRERDQKLNNLLTLPNNPTSTLLINHKQEVFKSICTLFKECDWYKNVSKYDTLNKLLAVVLDDEANKQALIDLLLCRQDVRKGREFNALFRVIHSFIKPIESLLPFFNQLNPNNINIVITIFGTSFQQLALQDIMFIKPNKLQHLTSITFPAYQSLKNLSKANQVRELTLKLIDRWLCPSHIYDLHTYYDSAVHHLTSLTLILDDIKDATMLIPGVSNNIHTIELRIIDIQSMIVKDIGASGGLYNIDRDHLAPLLDQFNQPIFSKLNKVSIVISFKRDNVVRESFLLRLFLRCCPQCALQFVHHDQ
ncbi:hypothetical protein SAMD00019534_084290, partial [Acytostelium subglobosum LB1]|uniref:hypothetical protein n=1 Tax=Acytostelium subglobosum LB1 TaxID=1410327 RepID=UPI0006448E19